MNLTVTSLTTDAMYSYVHFRTSYKSNSPNATSGEITNLVVKFGGIKHDCTCNEWKCNDEHVKIFYAGPHSMFHKQCENSFYYHMSH
jgi:hypothetical protein